MTVTSNERNQQNVFAKEPKMYYQPEEETMKFGFNQGNEVLNGRLAMLGIVAALGAYATTGQIVPGIF